MIGSRGTRLQPWAGWIALVSLCRHANGSPQPEDAETDAAEYVSLADLDGWREPLEPWSHWLIRRVFAGRVTVIAGDPTNPLQHHGTYL